LLEQGAEADVEDDYGKSAILYAAGKGFADIVGALLDTGVDVNKAYGNDLTALMWAAGYSNEVPPGDALKTVSLLIERGARLDLKDNRGKTARMIAADMGHEAVLKVLANAEKR
jgi:ankyrin repeat protein